MRGKTARHKPSRVDMDKYVAIKMYFYKLYRFVMLTTDVMFAIRNVLLFNSTRRLKFVISNIYQVRHQIILVSS